MIDSNHHARPAISIALCAAFGSAGCVIEKIDAIIAEHGVTYWPSSSGDDDGHLDEHEHEHEHE